jgi:hypothetical protein
VHDRRGDMEQKDERWAGRKRGGEADEEDVLLQLVELAMSVLGHR